MQTVKWDETLATGDPTVDQEHHKLFILVDELNKTDDALHGPEFISAVVDDILDYARSHFAHEESLMERSAYPDIERHRALHAAFAEEAERLSFENTVGATFSATGLAVFMNDWLREHIMAEDRRLVEHLRSGGAGTAS